jgi:hypothetical protein
MGSDEDEDDFEDEPVEDDGDYADRWERAKRPGQCSSVVTTRSNDRYEDVEEDDFGDAPERDNDRDEGGAI